MSSPPNEHSLAYQVEYHNNSISAPCHATDGAVGLPKSAGSNQNIHSYACFESVQNMPGSQPAHVSSEEPTSESGSTEQKSGSNKSESGSTQQEPENKQHECGSNLETSEKRNFDNGISHSLHAKSIGGTEHASLKAPTTESDRSHEIANEQKFENGFEHNLKFSSSLHEGSINMIETEIEDDRLVKSKNINDQGTSQKENSNVSQNIDSISLQQASELKNRKLILNKLNIGSGSQVDIQHILEKDYLLLATHVDHIDLGKICQPDLETVGQSDPGPVSQLDLGRGGATRQ